MERFTDLNKMYILRCNAQCECVTGNGSALCFFVPPGKGARHSVEHTK